MFWGLNYHINEQFEYYLTVVSFVLEMSSVGSSLNWNKCIYHTTVTHYLEPLNIWDCS